MSTIEQRIARLEEAFMLFCALVTGEPSDATVADTGRVQARYVQLMTEMRASFVSEALSRISECNSLLSGLPEPKTPANYENGKR